MKLITTLFVFLLVVALFVGGSWLLGVDLHAQINLTNTFVASQDNFDKQENDQQSLQTAAKTFREFDESTIDKNGFYLRIDKINLFKAVVKNVDPRYRDVYIKSWEKGISHGKFTALPDQIGITYLFAHALDTGSGEEHALEQNAWFSHLDQITVNDEVIVYYQGTKYIYQVSEIRVVSPDATAFYTGVAPVQKLRMQFCGPPTGSLDARTLVDALLVESQKINASNVQ